MASEFPALPRSYYEEAVAAGRARAEAPGRGGAARPPRGARRKRGAGVEGEAAPAPRQPLPLCFPLPSSIPLPHNAVVRHLLHRHEPPALALPIPLLGTAGDLFAVGKPPGLPVHAAGGYRKNTVVGVLEAADRAAAARGGDGGGSGSGRAHPTSPPRPVHRLDKPVSGVLLLARSAAAADAASAAIARREVAKTYVARVCGVFPGGLEEARGGGRWGGEYALPAALLAPHLSPADPFGDATDASAFTLDLALGWNPASHTATLSPGGPRLEAEVAGARHQAAWAAPGGAKPAATSFARLGVAPDGATSIVSCRPLTGRSHQIRAHLAALGHPIANDATYGGPYPGPERPRLPAHGGAAAPGGGTAGAEGHGGGGAACFDDGSDAGVAGALAALAQCEWTGAPASVGGGGGEAGAPAAAATVPQPPTSAPPSAASALAACPFCPSLARPWRSCELLPLWLHAAQYVGPGWAFACPVPRWGEGGWVPEGT